MTAAPTSGSSQTTGLLAVELERPNGAGRRVALYRREGNRIIKSLDAFTPFLVMQDSSRLKGCRVLPKELLALRGGGPLGKLALFASWAEWKKARAWLSRSGAADAACLAVNDPAQQYLTLSGRVLFEGLAFEQLRRMQVDIETVATPGYEFCNAEREGDRIVIIALGDESGWIETLTVADGGEKGLLEQFVGIVRERDPDVIEGHNIFQFDLPYLAARAARHGVPLALGRDGSLLRSHPSMFAAGDRTISFSKFEIAGRHIVDTYFLLHGYDAAHRSLEGFGLKEAAAHFGVAAPERTLLDASEMGRIFAQEPGKALRYAADDIRETRALAALLSRSSFEQTRVLPLGYQNVCLRGNAAKIDALMIREYLARRHALPVPAPPRAFEGGQAAIFRKGVLRNVCHCDVRSLYPSIMLTKRIGPRSDEEGVFLELLRHFRDYRLSARREMLAASEPAERARLEALQTAFKILINSFYGYLGFAQARFNDFAAAEQVAAEGRGILRNMLAWLESRGAGPVEMDTDGIYFIPPPFKSERDKAVFREQFRQSLPAGIEVEFDGEYAAMFSYKVKNYALLDASGKIIIRGAALKSRGLEPYLRAFLREYIRLKLEFRENEIPSLKARCEREIADGLLPIRSLARTETLKEAPGKYAEKIAGKGRGRNAAYELALRSGRQYQAGDQVSYYIAAAPKKQPLHEAARLVGDWSPAERDEDAAHYIAKLRTLCVRLESGQEWGKEYPSRKGAKGERGGINETDQG